MAPIVGKAPGVEMVEQEEPAPAPEVRMEAAISVGAVLSQSAFLADEDASFVASVRIQPRALEGLPKPPVSVALVLDTSGSMVGDPLEKAKEAALDFIDALEDQDQVALIVFHSTAEVLVSLTTLEKGRDAVRTSIEGLRAAGTTELAGGLAMGVAQVRGGLAGGGAARVVLLSDGQPNDAAQVLPAVEQAAREGITVTALGLGLEYDEELLGRIAQQTGGKFHFAESPDQMAALFRDEVLALQRIVGRNAQLRIAPGPGVTIKRVMGPAQSDGRNGFLLQAGDLVELRDRELIVQLESDGHRAGATIEVLDVELRFFDPLSQKQRLERAFVGALAVESRDSIEHDDAVALAASRALVADDALAAMTLARAGDLRGAKKRVAQALVRAKRDALRYNDDLLRERVGQLVELRKTLPDLAPPPVKRRRGWGMGPRPSTEPPIQPPRVGGLGTKTTHAAAMDDLGF